MNNMNQSARHVQRKQKRKILLHARTHTHAHKYVRLYVFPGPSLYSSSYDYAVGFLQVRNWLFLLKKSLEIFLHSLIL